MKKFLIGLLVVVAVLAVVGLFLPTEIDMERSTVIQAEPAAVHAHLDDLKRWRAWGPWHDEDPTIETKYGEKSSGVGAHMNWTGDKGDGELDLTRSDPETGIAYSMVFIDGDRRSPATGWMDLETVEGGTRVTWGMKSDFDMPVVGGYFRLIFMPSLEKMFDQGLANLKREVERGAG